VIQVSIHAPARGSDLASTLMGLHGGCFNPRSRAGERHKTPVGLRAAGSFNPRSRAGERPKRWHKAAPGLLFQSTLPRGGATASWSRPRALAIVSIHAPARGSDIVSPSFFTDDGKFQSTLPRGGATHNRPLSFRTPEVSIHAPARGSDGRMGLTISAQALFQSTLPRGGATTGEQSDDPETMFQSTLPRGGATPPLPCLLSAPICFNPRSRAGERR